MGGELATALLNSSKYNFQTNGSTLFSIAAQFVGCIVFRLKTERARNMWT